MNWRPVARILAFAFIPTAAAAAQTPADIQQQIDQLRQQLAQMDALKARLSELEQQLAALQKAQAATTPTVGVALKGSRMTVDGRVFVMALDSGAQGASPRPGTQVPDAKVRLTFRPSDRSTFVARLASPNGQNPSFDLFYVDLRHTFAPDGRIRVGQRKLDFGQETWNNDPVDSVVISNSVSNVTGYGIGIAGLGTLGRKAGAPVYELGFVNGPQGVSKRPSGGLPFHLKVGLPLPAGFFTSASVYATGSLGASDRSALSVAGIDSAPTNASAWNRTMWEVDARYNYGANGLRQAVPSEGLPKAMAAAAYGRFADDADGAPDRDGSFWYAEGLLRLTPRLYAGTRYSATILAGGQVARLSSSPVPVNAYRRTSIGLGYIFSNLLQAKVEYTLNDVSGGPSSPDLSQWAAGLAAKF